MPPSQRAEHEEFLLAITSGDTERAYAACELHMWRATSRLIRVMERAATRDSDTLISA